MKRSMRKGILLGALLGAFLLTSGCTAGMAQQPEEKHIAEGQLKVSVAPEPTDAPEAGGKGISAVEQPEGPLAPSGKSYAYYDTVEPTYVDGVLLVNKEYALPRDYGDGEDATAYQALLQLQQAAQWAGYSMPLMSGYRSFETQEELYNDYVTVDGVEKANTYSAWPGHSEHQTGLAFDVGWVDLQFADTPAGRWLANHAHEYGFIIRYPKGKEAITGYQFEPWHIRYLGVELASKVHKSGLCLEEYLGII